MRRCCAALANGAIKATPTNDKAKRRSRGRLSGMSRPHVIAAGRKSCERPLGPRLAKHTSTASSVRRERPRSVIHAPAAFPRAAASGMCTGGRATRHAASSGSPTPACVPLARPRLAPRPSRRATGGPDPGAARRRRRPRQGHRSPPVSTPACAAAIRRRIPRRRSRPGGAFGTATLRGLSAAARRPGRRRRSRRFRQPANRYGALAPVGSAGLLPPAVHGVETPSATHVPQQHVRCTVGRRRPGGGSCAEGKGGGRQRGTPPGRRTRFAQEDDVRRRAAAGRIERRCPTMGPKPPMLCPAIRPTRRQTRSRTDHSASPDPAFGAKIRTLQRKSHGSGWWIR